MFTVMSRFPAVMGALCAVAMLAPAASSAASPDGFETLAETLLPTVVNVSTSAKAPSQAQRPPLPDLPDLAPGMPGSPFDEFLKKFYEEYKNQQGGNGRPPEDDKVSALGSGFVVDAVNGYIVTNNHVIKGADEIKIILHDDTTLDATLVGTDEKIDIAVLKVKTDIPLVSTKWGNSDNSKVGSWVLAIGNPFGLGGTVTAGIVSARQRDINAGPYDDFIQTDASINRGNSGGPMFNMNGEVVGVNTAIFSPSGGSVGIGFAVPSNIVKNVVDQLIKYGKTKRGWLGVRIQDVTPDIAEGLGLPKNSHGALVSSVTEKGPSEAAGIQSGDVIMTFDGAPVSAMKRLPRMVAEAEVGRKVELGIWRKGENMKITVTLGELEAAETAGQLTPGGKDKPGTAPEEKLPTTDVPSIGVKLSLLTDEAREKYAVDKQVTGSVITEVTANGPASQKGLAEGDVIVEIDQQDVATPEDVATRVAAAEKAGEPSVLLFIARKNDRNYVVIKFKK